MIANISNSFNSDVTLSEKISYHISKIEEGKGEYLYDNFFKNDILKLYDEMKEVGEMNDKVDKKYFEVSLNLTPGEVIDNENFLQIAKEYMQRMGYNDACYAVIRHTDKKHQHLHILSTTTDYNGLHISNSNNFRNSQKISRDIERKYGLKVVEYNKFNSESLSKIKAREYYFSNALDKGLRNFSTKSELLRLLDDNAKLVFDNRFNNIELEILLGRELYQEVGEVLEKNNLFASLYKDELLQQLDSCYQTSNSKYEFFEKVHAVGLYVRTLTDKKGNLKLTYGLPNANIYFKDDRLPKKYRYSEISAFVPNGIMSNEEQKKAISSKAIVALKSSNSFQSYTNELDKIGVNVILHENSGGIYGMSFQMKDIENASIFKASEVSSDRSFSIANIKKYFSGEETSLDSLIDKGQTIEKNEMSIEEQKRQIKLLIKQNLHTVKSTQELQNKLTEKGVSLWIRKNEAGEIEGFSFKILSCSNAVPIKARDVSLNFDKELFKGIQSFEKGKDQEIKERYSTFKGHMSKVEQIEYIRLISTDFLNKNITLDDFTTQLSENGISFRVRRNEGVIKGFSFKMLNIGNAIPIRAREISKEFDISLFENFAPNELAGEVLKLNGGNNSVYIPMEASNDVPSGGNSNFEKHMDDNTLLSKKKKKKKKGMDLDI